MGREPKLPTKTLERFMRLAKSLLNPFKAFVVAFPQVSHPFPSRTRQLRLGGPMILLCTGVEK